MFLSTQVLAVGGVVMSILTFCRHVLHGHQIDAAVGSGRGGVGRIDGISGDILNFNHLFDGQFTSGIGVVNGHLVVRQAFIGDSIVISHRNRHSLRGGIIDHAISFVQALFCHCEDIGSGLQTVDGEGTGFVLLQGQALGGRSIGQAISLPIRQRPGQIHCEGFIAFIAASDNLLHRNLGFDQLIDKRTDACRVFVGGDIAISINVGVIEREVSISAGFLPEVFDRYAILVDRQTGGKEGPVLRIAQRFFDILVILLNRFILDFAFGIRTLLKQLHVNAGRTQAGAVAVIVPDFQDLQAELVGAVGVGKGRFAIFRCDSILTTAHSVCGIS